MIQESPKYEEWLTTIANTRFIYNTMDEFEDMLDNHSIHSNGIKRCFFTKQKLRSAFRDLKVEVENMTDYMVNLDRVLIHYQRAWLFFRENLHRRTNPEQVALDILSYCYPPYIENSSGTKRNAIFKKIKEHEINVPFLILMLIKVIPGYDSKEGDAVDMPKQYEMIMELLEKFTGNSTMFTTLPVITKARENPNKSRLMLLFHVSQILDTYESYAEQGNMYEMSNDIKANRINLDIAGYWNEHNGELQSTNFWQIENARDDGTYFVTQWRKNAENQVVGIRYPLFITEGTDGNLVYYMLHPEAIKHRMKGQKYGDADHVWYKTEFLDKFPDTLPLQRMLYSSVWPQKINLTRCTDEEVTAVYDRWLLKTCVIVKPYQHLEYYFTPGIYAITQEHIYIRSENEGEYYKVPRSACNGFERIQITDNVGIMTMNGRVYLAFDEFLLYISTQRKELQRYNIERVNCIG